MDQQLAKRIFDDHLGTPNDGRFKLDSEEFGVVFTYAGQQKLYNSDVGGCIDFSDPDNLIVRPEGDDEDEVERFPWGEVSGLSIDRPVEPPRFFRQDGRSDPE